MRALTVCVDYHDYLALSLPYNIRHFTEYWVVTSLIDHKTTELCRRLRNDNRWPIHLIRTDKFYEDGAAFNKYRAIEAALNIMERRGVLALLDADILWPKVIPPWTPEIGRLYTPKRRMFTRVPLPLPSENNWSAYPLHPQQTEWAGYTQIFHANDPVLNQPPWHDINWIHAGGGDSEFQAKWPREKKLRPPFEVLHLGEGFNNWMGRATPFIDGTVAPISAAKVDELRRLVKQRTRGPERFAKEKLPLKPS